MEYIYIYRGQIYLFSYPTTAVYICYFVCILFFQFIVYRKLNRISCVCRMRDHSSSNKKKHHFPDLIKHKYKAITHDNIYPFSCFSAMFYIYQIYIYNSFCRFFTFLFAHFLSILLYDGRNHNPNPIKRKKKIITRSENDSSISPVNRNNYILYVLPINDRVLLQQEILKVFDWFIIYFFFCSKDINYRNNFLKHKFIIKYII